MQQALKDQKLYRKQGSCHRRLALSFLLLTPSTAQATGEPARLSGTQSFKQPQNLGG